ncbi:hypothetical protein Patl1_29020 [Pistacia atlantica]|uniref:Uncharacterized protein n=1 Tax=Pistacia atlantica TaxID=434234 RepID=A0ACC1BH12_9ROSI|nr:hypothetical protein Patl1_29020 [Pistacia atlantica]
MQAQQLHSGNSTRRALPSCARDVSPNQTLYYFVLIALEMAHYQNQYGAVPHTDEYGNPVRQIDEHGNPVYQSSATTGDYGTAGFDNTTATGTGMRGHGTAPVAGTHLGTGHRDQRHHGLQRSGSSSSSSSSEDDGHGGRRKKGLKDKIKEKLPGGGHKDERYQATTTTTPGGYDVSGEGQHHQHEKTGMMEKIKEKLPGRHH